MVHLPPFTIQEQQRVDGLIGGSEDEAATLNEYSNQLQLQKDAVDLDESIYQKYMDNDVENVVEAVETHGAALDLSNPPATPHTFIRLDTFPLLPISLGKIRDGKDIEDFELRETLNGNVTDVFGPALDVTGTTITMTPGDYAGETLTFTSGIESGNDFTIATNTIDTFTPAGADFGHARVGDTFTVTNTLPAPILLPQTATAVNEDTPDAIDTDLTFIPNEFDIRDVVFEMTSGVELGNQFNTIFNTASVIISDPGSMANVLAGDTVSVIGGGPVVFSTTVNWNPGSEPTDEVIKHIDRWNLFDRLINQFTTGTKGQNEVLTLGLGDIGVVIDDLQTRTMVFEEDFGD